MNLQDSCSNHHPTTTRGFLRTVNWNLNGAFNAIGKSEASDDLKHKLEELAKAVQEMCKGLPEEKAETAARYLKSFTEEAAAKQPDKGILEVVGGTLKKAAEVVGELGAPVVKLVQAILPLFGIG